MTLASANRTGNTITTDGKDNILQVNDEVVMYLPYTYTGRSANGSISGIVQAPIGFLWDPAKETYAEAIERQMRELADAMIALRKTVALSEAADIQNLI